MVYYGTGPWSAGQHLTRRCSGGHEAHCLWLLVGPFVAPLNASVRHPKQKGTVEVQSPPANLLALRSRSATPRSRVRGAGVIRGGMPAAYRRRERGRPSGRAAASSERQTKRVRLGIMGDEEMSNKRMHRSAAGGILFIEPMQHAAPGDATSLGRYT